MMSTMQRNSERADRLTKIVGQEIASQCISRADVAAGNVRDGLGVVSHHRVPVIGERQQEIHPVFLCKLHYLVQSGQTIGSRVERRGTVCDELEPSSIIRNLRNICNNEALDGA